MISIALHIFDFLVYLVYFQSRRLISCIFPKQTAHILISFKLTMDIIERVQQFPKLPRGFAFGICLFQICRMNSYRDSPHAFARRFGSLFSFSDKRALILSFYCFLLKISSSSLFFSFWWIFRGPFLWVHTLAGCGLGLWAPQSDAHYPCRHILFCFFRSSLRSFFWPTPEFCRGAAVLSPIKGRLLHCHIPFVRRSVKTRFRETKKAGTQMCTDFPLKE